MVAWQKKTKKEQKRSKEVLENLEKHPRSVFRSSMVMPSDMERKEATFNEIPSRY